MNSSRILVRPFPLLVLLLAPLIISLGVLGLTPELSSGQAFAAAAAAAPDPGAAAAPAAPAAEGPPTPAPGSEEALREAERRAQAAFAESGPEAGDTQPEGEGKEAEAKAPEVQKQINLLQLLRKGGGLMIPIGLMSFLVVVFGFERFMGLRRRKVLPFELTDGIANLTGQPGGFDPRKAYKLCQQYPSAAANVMKAMLLKVGRPQTEVEHAVSEANKREAARLYSNVRWLSLAAGVTPLLGLLGTVWGMIQAFFVTANLPPGANKSQALAGGIYVALVTTFAGLAVAIPAAILAHWFEGHIQKLFRQLDETLLGLMPQLERFEGRLRVNKDAMEQSPSQTHSKPPPVPPSKPAESRVRHDGSAAQAKQSQQQRTPK